MVALGRVVVDHVEDDLDVGGVQGLDHCLELGHLSAGFLRGRVGVMRREVADRVVSPVVRQALACSVVSLVNWWIGMSSTVVTPSFVRCSMIAGCAMPA